MTKDTKVGLVIGLAFIVGVVILLNWAVKPGEAERQTEHYRPADAYDSHVDREPVILDTIALSARDRVDLPMAKDSAGQGLEDAGLSGPVESLFSHDDSEPVESTSVDLIVEPVRPKPVFHVVKEGETLYDIAVAVYGPGKGHKWKIIQEANKYKITNGHMIRPGLRLLIPPLESSAADMVLTPVLGADDGRNYTVQPGDTLSDISLRKLGTSRRWREIMRLNGLASEMSLRPGMILKLPPVSIQAEPRYP